MTDAELDAIESDLSRASEAWVNEHGKKLVAEVRRLKSALDLLRGIAYGDDAQVQRVTIARTDDERAPARLVVDVWPIEGKAA